MYFSFAMQWFVNSQRPPKTRLVNELIDELILPRINID